MPAAARDHALRGPGNRTTGARGGWDKRLALLFVGVVLGACASAPASLSGERAPQPQGSLRELVQQHAVVPEAREQPLRLDDEMRAWLKRSVPRMGAESERAGHLLLRLSTLHQDGWVYQQGFNGTAEETFHQGRFNCLSFSHLYVALARELGLDAFYVVLDRQQQYDHQGDLLVTSLHITAGYRAGNRTYTLELAVGPALDYSRGSVASDATALALHYSNRGIERLSRGDPQGAVEHLATAVEIDSSQTLAWVNLGVALRRTGLLQAAEESYLFATSLDPEYLPAYGNLAALSSLRGDPEATRRLLGELDRRATRNPFVLLTLGDWRLAEGELDRAQRLYRRAYGLARDRAETRAAMGEWAVAVGKHDEAVRWLERAREANPESPRVARLERLLGV